MTDEQFTWSGYFEWLIEQIDGNSDDNVDMRPVLLVLNKKLFRKIHPMDENRILDVRKMREDYAWSCHDELDDKDYYVTPSVLEVLVCLCIKIEQDVTGVIDEEDPANWFWIFLENLGIDSKCTGKSFSKQYIVNRIDKWLRNDISKHGEGSPFPLHHNSSIDMRTKDIWQAAMCYVNETLRYW